MLKSHFLCILTLRDPIFLKFLSHPILLKYLSHPSGPSGLKYVGNDFLTWFNTLTSNPNSKNLYERILKVKYGSCELTAMKKLAKTPYLGLLNEKRICSALGRIARSVNTARTLRASLEFALGSFRTNVEIAIFSNTNQPFCHCCGTCHWLNISSIIASLASSPYLEKSIIIFRIMTNRSMGGVELDGMVVC